MGLPSIRNLFRFNLSTLICAVLAVNLVVYMNFLAKQPYFNYVYEGPNQYVRSGENYTRVTDFLIGWPVKFLRIEKTKVGATPANKPLFERNCTIISWSAAAQTGAVSLILIAIYTWVLVRLLGLLSPAARRKAGRKSTSAGAPELYSS